MPKAATTGAKHRRWGLFAALLALFAQALLPAAALAIETARAQQTVLCTAEGPQIVTLDAQGEPRQGFGGLPCQECLGVTLAVVVPPPTMVNLAPFEPSFSPPAAAPAAPLIARTPPRPPGQGPPRLFA
jgi:hypothetical protein